MKLIHFFKRFYEIPKVEKRLLLFGVIFYYFFKLVIILLPLKYYKSFPLTNNRIVNCNCNDENAIRLVRKTINRIDRLICEENNCLIKALAFKKLLNLIGINCTMQFELIKVNDDFIYGHVFILYNNKPIYLNRNVNERFIVPYNLNNTTN